MALLVIDEADEAYEAALCSAQDGVCEGAEVPCLGGEPQTCDGDVYVAFTDAASLAFDGLDESGTLAETTCDDGIDCTDDSCDAATGDCTSTENDSACDDQESCTDDLCDGSTGCVGDAQPEFTACQSDSAADCCTASDASLGRADSTAPASSSSCSRCLCSDSFCCRRRC